jgi:lipopolysaccharide biosynthesis glycosyltransferase
LANYAVGAVIDKLASDISLFDRLGYPNEKGYFNAGVLLINLEKWRSDHIEDDFVAVLNNYSDKIKYEDQDVLNVVLQDKKIFIPIKYNFQTPFFRKNFIWGYRKYEEEFKQDLNDPVIVHYSTSNKPWNWNSYDPHPYKSTFCKYQNMTIWSYKTLNRPSFIRMAKYVIGDFLRQIKIKAPLQSSYINIPPID